MSIENGLAVHVAIIGAGPYGLSLAAHLRNTGVTFRIFGSPMQSWKTQMPETMTLKADARAMNLSTGGEPYTFAQFCRETGRTYHDTHVPMPLADFVAYGDEFARRFVPTLEPINVGSLTRGAGLFHLGLATGETVHARNVVIATGVSLFDHLPTVLRGLPPDMVTHTAAHRSFAAFAGKQVAVLGRGASALNAAALLHEEGAHVTLVSRSANIVVWKRGPQHKRRLRHRILHPASLLGPSMRSFVSANFPRAMHTLPHWLRHGLTYKHLGPSASSSLDGRMEGFPILRGWRVASASLAAPAAPRGAEDRRLHLVLENDAGQRQELFPEHLIAGTGYVVDLARLTFLSPELRAAIATFDNQAPRLKRTFQSSVPGLYFIGPASAESFGPLLKFAAGCTFAAAAVTRSLRKKQQRVKTTRIQT